MAAGIIDHETGTRDIRRAARPVPVDADHRHAGDGGQRGDGGAAAERLPSKEMFFAETLHVGDRNWWMSYAAVAMGSAWPIRCASSSVFFGTPAQGLPANCTSRRAGCAFRSILRCVGPPGGGRRPRREHPTLRFAPGGGRHLARRAGLHDLAVARLQPAQSLMSVRARGRRAALRRRRAATSTWRWRERVPPPTRLNGAQAYRDDDVAAHPRCRWLLRRVGTRQLQPQLMLRCSCALLILPLLAGARRRGP